MSLVKQALLKKVHWMLDKILALFGKCGQLPQNHKETDVLKNFFILDPHGVKENCQRCDQVACSPNTLGPSSMAFTAPLTVFGNGTECVN